MVARNSATFRIRSSSLVALVVAAFVQIAAAGDVQIVNLDQLSAMFVRKGIPQYPYEAQRDRIEGAGVFRMYIAPSGEVTSVGVMRSTGSNILDLAAAGGLYQWRAKPGRRREVDVPMAFHKMRSFPRR